MVEDQTAAAPMRYLRRQKAYTIAAGRRPGGGVRMRIPTAAEQVKLIGELEAEEKTMVFKMIDTFLTKKKFKDFFQQNVAAM